MCLCDNYKFHAAGREDINVQCTYFSFFFLTASLDLMNVMLILWNYSVQVRMLGSGRPFLVEIQNSRHVPSEALLKEIEVKINNLENKLVS